MPADPAPFNQENQEIPQKLRPVDFHDFGQLYIP